MAAPRHEDDKNYYIYNQYGDNTMKPIGPIGLIAHNLASDFSDSVNFFLRNRRAIYVNNLLELAATPGFMRSDYRIAVNTPRFTSGEGKAIISQTVRGHDLFIITDVLNRSSTYTRFSQETEMSPDEHYQDLIRIILAVTGHARRINVIMPYLYEGRQYRRNARESLDCAAMLKYLFSLGVQNIITFDAHDGRVANAVPRMGFENIQSAYQIIESMIHVIDDLRLDKEHFMVISPDETGLSRAMYYASMFEVPLGTFYRKRNYQVNVDGNYQVVGQAFLGDDVRGLDCLIIDDMIVTGQTVLRVASDLKSRGARRVFVAVTFAQFTSGIDAFHQAHAEGIIDRIFSTNLIYRPPELLAAPWFVEADASRFVALLIDAINHDASLSKLVTPTEKIQKLLDYYRRRNG